ncbi:MAG: polysaccharide deacetylase family protein [Candidatus Binatia bacterium]
MLRNAITIDVEDWHHDAEGLGGRALAGVAPRVEANLRRLLDLLDGSSVHATLFFLGEVAERHPDLVREAAARGHEIASHGYRHLPLSRLLRREFRDEVRRSLGLLRDLIGAPVVGFRAPYFSIKAGVGWPVEILAQEGVVYDSSILPIDRAPGLEVVSPRVPYRLPAGLWEIPVAVPRYLFWNVPLFGGFALRALPIRFVERRLVEFNRSFGPAVLHLHPWEIDVEGPEVETLSPLVRSLKRVGRGGLERKLQRLLAEYSFGSIAEAFPDSALGDLRRKPTT